MIGQAVPGMYIQVKLQAGYQSLLKGSQGPGRLALSAGVGIAAGVQLHGIGADIGTGLYLIDVRIDEHGHFDTRGVHLFDNLPGCSLALDHVQSTFSGNLLAFLRDQADLVGL